jgi:hypothetical protein
MLKYLGLGLTVVVAALFGRRVYSQCSAVKQQQDIGLERKYRSMQGGMDYNDNEDESQAAGRLFGGTGTVSSRPRTEQLQNKYYVK